jgi:ribose transport system ATP-binding protein
MPKNSKPILEMKKISKAFPGVQALDNVDFDLYPGEVHILIGENGAGKSTLMKVLAGAYTSDQGEIHINQEHIPHWNPSAAKQHGISMVFQEFTLLPYRTVCENIFLGRELTIKVGLLDKPSMYQQAEKLLDSIGIDVDTRSLIINLGVADQQMVEISKALAAEAKILVLDEPTSALSLREIEKLFSIIRVLKANGVGIIYISHRLDEIKQIGDRVTVMRDGKLIGTKNVSEISLNEIIGMMVGREIKELFPRHYTQPGDMALRVKDLCSGKKVNNIDLELHFGEIVGLAGLVGSGRTETARAIFGLDPVKSGSIEVEGHEYHTLTPPIAVKLGIGFVPEDRRRDGLFSILSVQQNVVMASLNQLFPSRLISYSKEKTTADYYVKKFNLQPPLLDRMAQFLSGGNQQKLVLGKWMAANPRIIIIDEPTRGIDVGAKSEIHAFMDQLVNAGHAILMISSELPEILGMSDRIYVMHEGCIAGEFSRGANSEEILRCAMGVN